MAVHEEKDNLKENIKSLVNSNSTKLLNNPNITKNRDSWVVYLRFLLTAPYRRSPVTIIVLRLHVIGKVCTSWSGSSVISLGTQNQLSNFYNPN